MINITICSCNNQIFEELASNETSSINFLKLWIILKARYST